jgi:predicted CoA-substrate-specific enzyme activase
VTSLGLDIGSLFSKAVLLRDGQFLASVIIDTPGNVTQGINKLIAEATSEGHIAEAEVDICVSTGQGSNLVEQSDFVEDDVVCITTATRHFLPETRLIIIDVGGQSITTILMSSEGEILNFMRNDKCASGSGRFIEVIGHSLGVPIDQIDQVAAQSQKKISLSTQCAVFAESEVISHLNRGESPANIIASVCESVAMLVISQALRFGSSENYTLTGGVTRLATVSRIIKERLGRIFYSFPVNPQLAAAYGAALIGISDTSHIS